MGRSLFCFPNRADSGTYSGGSWEASLPLSNLATEFITEKARSTDDAVASTQWVNDLGAAYPIRAVSLHGHNLSLAAQHRIRLYPTGAVTRADTATYFDEDGVVTAAANNILRNWHYVRDTGGTDRRVTLIERAHTNLVTTHDFSAWSDVGTPTATGSISDPAGGTAAYRIGDDDGAAAEAKYFAPSFTGDNTKAVAFVVREATHAASGQILRLRDNTAATVRGQLDITSWSNGEPSVTASTGTLLGKQPLSDGYWLLMLQCPGVVAANANRIEIYPAGGAAGETGTIDVYRVGAYNAPTPPASSLTASEATTTDEIAYTLLDATPQEATYLYDSIVLDLPGGGEFRFLVNVGDAGAGNPQLAIYLDDSTTRLYVYFENDTTSTTGYFSVPSLVMYDRIRVRIYQAASGALTLGLTINDGAEDTTPDGSPSTIALPAAWANSTVRLGGRMSGGSAFAANSGLISFRAQSGAERSVAEMAALQAPDIADFSVHDSQWTSSYGTIYPATSSLWGDDVGGEALSSEDWSDGVRPDLFEILPVAHRVRSCSVEFNDTANADTYVEVGRCVVAQAYQPAVSRARQGASLGYTRRSTRVEMAGGAIVTHRQLEPRSFAFTLPHVEEDEALVQLLEFQRRLSITEQVLFIFDPDDTVHLHRRSFLAYADLDPLGLGSAFYFDQPIVLTEVIQ